MYDLHFHSTKSDGMKSNDEIIDIAYLMWNVDFLVCTDHDFVNREFPIEAICKWMWSCEWVEISTDQWHVLFYNNLFKDELISALDNRKFNKEKLDKLFLVLNKDWFIVDIKWFIKYLRDWWHNSIKNINYTMIAKYFLSISENCDIAKNKFWKDELDLNKIINYFAISLSAIPDKSLEKFVSLVDEKNTIISLAHPQESLWNVDNFNQVIKNYVDRWLNAIEINSRADQKWVNEILDTSRKLWLMLTFGSDCHFWPNWLSNESRQLFTLNKYLDDEFINSYMKIFKNKIYS